VLELEKIFLVLIAAKQKVLYSCNCLEWHPGDETVKQTPQGTVWSCRIASESFDCFNRFAVALAKSQDHRASCGVFAFGNDWFQVTIGLWIGMREA
jgi:hypothetical protein